MCVCVCVCVCLWDTLSHLGAMIDDGVLPDDQPRLVQRDHVTALVRPFSGHLEDGSKYFTGQARRRKLSSISCTV